MHNSNLLTLIVPDLCADPLALSAYKHILALDCSRHQCLQSFLNTMSPEFQLSISNWRQSISFQAPHPNDLKVKLNWSSLLSTLHLGPFLHDSDYTNQAKISQEGRDEGMGGERRRGSKWWEQINMREMIPKHHKPSIQVLPCFTPI